MQFLTPEFRERFMRSVRKTESCWIWTRPPRTDGYGQVLAFDGLKRKVMTAHRVSYLMHHGPLVDGLCVLHSCDTPLCVNPDHLSLGTHLDNMADMVAKGRQVKGRGRLNSKLCEAAVIEIRRRHGEGESQTTIGRDFGVTRKTVFMVATRRAWKHVAALEAA